MTEAEKYVKRFLKKELTEVRASSIANVRSSLDIFERTIIYHYTDEGYKNLNLALRKSKGRQTTKYGKLLSSSIQKLPDYQGLVYRTVWVTKKDILRYIKANENSEAITEYSFLSTSKAVEIVESLSKWNCQFQIISKTGKSIEELSKLGKFSSLNEEEVIFLPKTAFTILNVTEKPNYVLILMKEL